MYGATYVKMSCPAAAALRMILSSTSVMFMTCVTRRPRYSQPPPQQVAPEERAQVADVRMAVDGRPARVHPHLARHERDERLFLARQGVEEAEVGHAGVSIE